MRPSRVLSQQVLQNLDVQLLVGDQPLEAPILFLERIGTTEHLPHRPASYPGAAGLLGESLELAGAGSARWLLDSPVSNSGRLRTLLLELAGKRGWD